MPKRARGKRQLDRQKTSTNSSPKTPEIQTEPIPPSLPLGKRETDHIKMAKDIREGKLIFGVSLAIVLVFIMSVLAWSVLFSGGRDVRADYIVTVSSITEGDTTCEVGFSNIDTNPGLWAPENVTLSKEDTSKLEVGKRYSLMLKQGNPDKIISVIGPLRWE